MIYKLPAKRNSITPAGVQAALWYESRLPDVEASSYLEAMQLNKRYIEDKIIDIITVPPQLAINYRSKVNKFIKGSGLEERHSSYSEHDIGNRKLNATKQWPHMVFGQFYATDTTPEHIVTSSKRVPHIVNIPINVYDGVADHLQIWTKAFKAKNLEMHANINNIFAKMIKDAGYDGFSYKGSGGTEFALFGKTPVMDAPVTEEEKQVWRDKGVPLFSKAPAPDTKEFKDLTKSSKAVDGDGNLLTLYHGTPFGSFAESAKAVNKARSEIIAKRNKILDNKLEVYRMYDWTSPESDKRAGRELIKELEEEERKLPVYEAYKRDEGDVFRYVGTNDAGYLGQGFYFSADENVAGKWANYPARSKRAGEKSEPFIYSVYLDMRKPFRQGVDEYTTEMAEKEQKIYKQLSYGRRGVEQLLASHAAAKTQMLQSFGYDGVIGETAGKQGLEYMVFKDSQVKIIKGEKIGTEDDQFVARGIRFSFAGAVSQTADKSQLDKAITDIESGKSKESVRKSTGWFKGHEDKWRYEIDDSKLKLKPEFMNYAETGGLHSTGPKWGEWRLSEIIDHPELFKAYPIMKNMEVHFVDLGGIRGQYTSRKIEINQRDTKKNFNKDNIKTLLHEVQHSIQAIEGFTRGTSPEKQSYRALEEAGNPIYLFRLEMKRKYGKDFRFEMTKEELIKEEELLEIWRSPETGFERYKRQAGEIEAREVEKRLDFDEADRKMVEPYKDGIPHDQILFSKQQKWYSSMEKVVAAKDGLPQKAPAKSIIQSLKSWAKKGKIKEEEMKWSGVIDWLEKKEGKVTKDKVIEYLQENNVRVEEVWKGVKDTPELEKLYFERGRYINRNETVPKELDNKIKKLEKEVGNTQYESSDLNLPGGTDYTELLLKLPSRKPTPTEDLSQEMYNKSYADLTNNERIKVNKASKEERYELLTGFTGQHFQRDKNILVHVRFDTRMVDGKKVLFLEEIQSDWAADIRKLRTAEIKRVAKEKGIEEEEAEKLVSKDFGVKGQKPKIVSVKKWTKNDNWENVYTFDDKIEIGASSREEAFEQHYLETYQEGRLPDMPYKDSSKYALLAIKRMVRHAADNGYDSIAWTTGEQQVERYKDALRKAVDKIEWTKTPEGIHIVGFKDGEEVHDSTEGENNLEAAIGKAMGDQIIESKDQSGSFEGEEITISDTGMAGFYDIILPSIANKFFKGKKWGKAKVGTIEIGTDRPARQDRVDSGLVKPKTAKVHNLPITPEMRTKSLTEGMQLFSKAPAPDTKEFKEMFKDTKVVDSKGDPLQVYHGTPEKITAFDKDKTAYGIFWFTNNKSEANVYGYPTYTEPGAYYLNIQNPALGADINKAAKKVLSSVDTEHPAKTLENLKVIEQLQKEGFNGAIAEDIGEGGDYLSYIAFYPNQIKSAFNQKPTSDDRIMFSKKLSPAAEKFLNANAPDKLAGYRKAQAIQDKLASKPPEQTEGKPHVNNPDYDRIFENSPEEERTRIEISEGVGEMSEMEKWKDRFTNIKNLMTRARQHLDPARFGGLLDIFRLHQDSPIRAHNETATKMTGFVEKIKSVEQRRIFELRITMADMLGDIDSGLVEISEGETYPFGFKTRKRVEDFISHLENLSDPETTDAIDRRNNYIRNLGQRAVNHGILKAGRLRKDYYHHQVLIHRAMTAENKKYVHGLGTSTEDLRLKKKGWQIARKGDLSDYNTNYFQSEFEVIAQLLTQIATKKALDKVGELHDAYEGLADKAEYENDALFNQKLAQEPALLDEYKRLTKNMAIGIGNIKKLADKGELTNIGPFQSVVDSIVSDTRTSDPDFFKFLSHLMASESTGALGAATFLKNYVDRNTFKKDTLGKQFKTYADFIKDLDGYTTWQPDSKGIWFLANSVPDQVLERVREGGELPNKIHKVWARTSGRPWVVPVEVAKSLDEFKRSESDHPFSVASRTMISGWKQWTLMNPYRVLKYNINNMSGDTDITLAYTPAIMGKKYFGKAYTDSLKQLRNKPLTKAEEGRLDNAEEHSITTASWGIQEVTGIEQVLARNSKEVAAILSGDKRSAPRKAFDWYWKNAQKITIWRENLLRLASYYYFQDQIKQGKKPGIDLRGASKPKELRSMVADGATDDQLAAKLSRELIGDYGNLTQAGQWIRNHMIPFYSWMEINGPRYVRLMRNMPMEGKGTKDLTTAVAGKMAWQGTKLGLQAMILYTAVMLWNKSVWPEEEKKLGDLQRRQLHIILGKKSNGDIMTLRFQGALSDALEWFGLGDIIQDVKDLREGRKTLSDKAIDVPKAITNRLFIGSRPIVKMVGEVALGRSVYPDLFNPRPIRDKWEHVWRTFSFDMPYRYIAGKPKRGDNVTSQLLHDVMSLGLYTADPGEASYYQFKKSVFDYLDKISSPKPYIIPTSRQNALYYYKQSLKYGDLKTAKKYLDQYLTKYGGTRKGIKTSIKMTHPLASIPNKHRRKFFKSLDSEQKDVYKRALDWYNRIYKKRRKTSGIPDRPNI